MFIISNVTLLSIRNGTERKEEEGIKKNKNLKKKYILQTIFYGCTCVFFGFFFFVAVLTWTLHYILYKMLFVYVAYKINMVNKIYKHVDGQMN